MKNILYLLYLPIWLACLISTGISANIPPDSLCGTLDALDSIMNGEQILRPKLSGTEYSISSDHFKIHYSLEGEDASSAAYAESVKVFAEISWQKEVGELGWQAPPSDGTKGGDSKYDMYIKNNGPKHKGETIPEGLYHANGIGGCPSFSAIQDSLDDISLLKEMVAHEFCHALEYSIASMDDGMGAGRFAENTATWIVQYVYPNDSIIKEMYIAHINFMGPLNFNFFSLNDGGDYDYGGALWCEFLSEWVSDSSVVKRIWQRMGSTSGWNLMENIANELESTYSRNIYEALKQYGLWRALTGVHADHNHFKDAFILITSYCPTITTYPFILDTTSLPPRRPGGMRTISFAGGSGRATFTFNGGEDHLWTVFLIGLRDTNRLIDTIPLTNGAGSKIVEWANADSFVFAPVLLDTVYDTVKTNFSIHVTEDPRLKITFTNVIHAADAGGRLMLDNIDTLLSSDSRYLDPLSSHTIRTLNERFVQDSIYKHHDWNGIISNDLLSDTFTVRAGNDIRANYYGLVPEILRNELIDAPAINGGSIHFRDPWYLDENGNQPDSFKTYDVSTPFSLTGAYGQTSGGIFLNQGKITDLQPPFYSMKAFPTQVISGDTSYFIGWSSCKGAAFVQPANQETPVIFNSPNDTIQAIYKGHLITTDSVMARYNGQNKMLRTKNGSNHMVYSSGGNIWYTKNTGSGWSPEYLITSLGSGYDGKARNPAIGCVATVADTILYIVWEDTLNQQSGCLHRVRFRSSTDNGGSWSDPVLITNSTYFNPMGIDATPVIAGSSYLVICWRYGNGSNDGGLAAYYSDDTMHSIGGVLYNAPLACSPSVCGEDPVSLAYIDSNKVKYKEFLFGRYANTPQITDSAYLPMPSETYPANPAVLILSYDNVLVAWDAIKSGNRHIFASRRVDVDWPNPSEFIHGSDQESRPCLTFDYKAQYTLMGWECLSGQFLRSSLSLNGSTWSPIATGGNGRSFQMASNAGAQSYASNAWISGSAAPYSINTATEAAAGPPQLASPSNGAVDQSRTPTLIWNLALDAEKYHLQVSQNRAFTGTPAYENTNITADSQTIPSNYILLYHTKYYWRVSSKNYIGEGSYSSVDSFTTAGTTGNASMSSQSAVVTGSNGQRKTIRDSNRFLHFVYDSSGAIYYGQSTNNGSSWIYPAKISGTLTNCGQPAITERAETLYVVFGRNISSNTWDVDYTYSTDGGFNWKTTPVQNASSISCPGAGPLPVTQVSSPSDPFELLIAYQRSVDIRTSYTTTRPTISSNWTTITLDGSDSASVTPTLGYDCHSGSGNFYILTKRISQLRLQRFYYTSWDNPGFNYANGSFSGYVYYLSDPTLAYTSNNVEWVAFEGYHQAYYDDVILALKNQNTSEFTEFYDQNYYNHHYHRPVMSGLSGSRAVLLWAADTTSVTKVIYNGSSWGSPTGWGSNNNYPTVTISNPPGDTAFAFWRSGTSSPYSISTNSNGGPLYKTTAPMTYSRRLDIQDRRTGNIVSLDLAPPEFDDGLASVSLPFVETNDDSVYTVDNIWQALQTEPVTLGNVASDEMTSIRRIAIHVKNASGTGSPVQLRFEAVDAQNGVVRATENVSLSETDTTLSGEDEMSLDVGQLAGHKVFFRLVPAQSLNDSDYTVALGHIYCFNDTSVSNKSGSKRRDRFAQQQPNGFSLSANYPNPFNPVTNVEYALPEKAIVRMVIYNTAGQEVARVLDELKEAGRYSVRWNALNHASGMYFLRMTATSESGKTLFNKSEKLVLVK